jgi:hypothetical protein
MSYYDDFSAVIYSDKIDDGKGNFITKTWTKERTCYTLDASTSCSPYIFHRLDGPAVIWHASQQKEWWINGVCWYIQTSYDYFNQARYELFFVTNVIKFMLDIDKQSAKRLLKEFKLYENTF